MQSILLGYLVDKELIQTLRVTNKYFAAVTRIQLLLCWQSTQ
jgi:hypothetical protein